VLLDLARLSVRMTWSARIAVILVSGGFFGVAYLPALRFILYAGAALVEYATLAVGIGLLRSLPGVEPLPAPTATRRPAPA
jgi:hypothetical protein